MKPIADRVTSPSASQMLSVAPVSRKGRPEPKPRIRVMRTRVRPSARRTSPVLALRLAGFAALLSVIWRPSAATPPCAPLSGGDLGADFAVRPAGQGGAEGGELQRLHQVVVHAGL